MAVARALSTSRTLVLAVTAGFAIAIAAAALAPSLPVLAVASMSLAEIEADSARGDVVLRSDVESDADSFCAALNTGLGSTCNAIASRANTMTNATEIEDLCRAEISRSFQSARTVLAEKWGERPEGSSRK